MSAGRDASIWIGTGKVRARETGDTVELTIDGLTTQAKYYKPLVYEFMRKEWTSRPSYGDYTVEILMEHVGDPPWMDLDNLAKAHSDIQRLAKVFFLMESVLLADCPAILKKPKYNLL